MRVQSEVADLKPTVVQALPSGDRQNIFPESQSPDVSAYLISRPPTVLRQMNSQTFCRPHFPKLT